MSPWQSSTTSPPTISEGGQLSPFAFDDNENHENHENHEKENKQKTDEVDLTLLTNTQLKALFKANPAIQQIHSTVNKIPIYATISSAITFFIINKTSKKGMRWVGAFTAFLGGGLLGLMSAVRDYGKMDGDGRAKALMNENKRRKDEAKRLGISVDEYIQKSRENAVMKMKGKEERTSDTQNIFIKEKEKEKIKNNVKYNQYGDVIEE